MVSPITLTLIILAIAVILFITEKLSIDLIALLVLVSLAVTGLVTPEEALSGFSSPAVVTIWAVFILSAGLERTGVAAWIGRQVMRLGGTGELRRMLVIMLASAFLSAFMNNIGVTAMMLPVVLDIARRTNRLPSKILIPLAFSSLLGGMITLIGSPPNILVSGVLEDFGYQPFSMFDFAPMGIAVTIGGLIFLSVFGHRLLPSRHPVKELGQGEHEVGEGFALEERLMIISIPINSPLSGRTLAQSRLGAALRLNVIAILRAGETDLAPNPDSVLLPEDKLLVIGRPDKLDEWRQRQQLNIRTTELTLGDLVSEDVQLVEVEITPQSMLIGHTLQNIGFRQKFGSTVLALLQNGRPRHNRLENQILHPGDRLLLHATTQQVEEYQKLPDFNFPERSIETLKQLSRRLLMVDIPAESHLCNRSIAESHFGDAYGIGVLGFIRAGETHLLPNPYEKILPGDNLLVKGRREDINSLIGLQDLIVDRDASPTMKDMESEQIGMVEVVLSPQSTIAGQTLRSINFREKYGLNVLALWRAGRPIRFDLRDQPLRFGDAMLVFGPRQRLRQLARDTEFLVLTEDVQPPALLKKAPIASLLMLSMVLTVGFGLLPIQIAAIAGSVLMVLTGCLTMAEAHRAIHWRSVFLIAGMLPLGTAVQTSGTAEFIASAVQSLTAPYGITAQIAGLFLMAAIASQIMPNPVVTVLMAPIAITIAQGQGLSPYALAMVVAVAASASFLSPVGHPANVLIMGPGGYKFKDYFKVGIPLMLVIMVITILLLPIIWPL